MRPMGFRSSLAGLENTRTAEGNVTPNGGPCLQPQERRHFYRGRLCQRRPEQWRGVARRPRLWITKEDGDAGCKAGPAWCSCEHRPGPSVSA